jgi:hypothetical protein
VAGPRGTQSCRSLPVNCPPHQWRLRKEDPCPGCWKIWRPGFGGRRPAANGKAPRQDRVANHVSFRLPAVSLEILLKGRLHVLPADSIPYCGTGNCHLKTCRLTYARQLLVTIETIMRNLSLLLLFHAIIFTTVPATTSRLKG